MAVYFTFLRNPLLKSYARYLLSTWQTPERRRWLDKLLYSAVSSAWFRYEYWPEQDPDVRERKKELCMGGQSGLAWAKHYDSRPLDFSGRVGNITLYESNPVYSALQGALSASNDDAACVIQIGSSSGREIAWVADSFPGVRCIGTDIYSEVVEYSRKTHYAKNLEFRLLRAKDIGQLVKDLANVKVIVFSSGSLQYVQPEHVEVFFGALSQVPGAQVVLMEPASTAPCDPRNLNESMPRGNFSYTHNYQAIAERNNLVTLECKILHPYGPSDPIHPNTAHYFWNGLSKEGV